MPPVRKTPVDRGANNGGKNRSRPLPGIPPAAKNDSQEDPIAALRRESRQHSGSFLTDERWATHTYAGMEPVKLSTTNPYVEGFVPDTIFPQYQRAISQCLAGKTSISTFIHDLLNNVDFSKKQASKSAAHQIAAEMATRQRPVADFNYLQGLGLDDEIYAQLLSILTSATADYRELYTTEEGEEKSLRDLQTLHRALIKVFMQLLSASTRHGDSFQFILLTPKQSLGDLTKNFRVVVKKPNLKGEVVTSEYILDMDRNAATPDPKYRGVYRHEYKGIYSCDRNQAARSGSEAVPRSESYGRDLGDFVFTDKDKIEYMQPFAGDITVNTDRSDLVDELEIDFDEYIGELQEKQALLRRSARDKPNKEPERESEKKPVELEFGPVGRLKAEIDFLRQNYIECYLPLIITAAIHAYQIKNKKVGQVLDEKTLAAIRFKEVKRLGDEFNGKIEAGTSSSAGLFAKAETAIDILTRQVAKAKRQAAIARQAYRYSTNMDSDAAKALTHKISKSAIANFSNQVHEPYSDFENFKNWCVAHPWLVGIVGVAVIGVIAAGALGMFSSDEQGPCDGYLNGQGDCVEVGPNAELPDANCAITNVSPSTINEGGSLTFEISCPDLNVEVTGTNTFELINVPHGSVLTFPDGTSVTQDTGSIAVPESAVNAGSFTLDLPNGYSGNLALSAQHTVVSGARADTDPFTSPTVAVNPVAGTATIGITSSDFTVLENHGTIGNPTNPQSTGTVVINVQAASGDSAANLYVQDVPVGATVTATAADGTSFTFTGTAGNSGVGTLLSNINGPVTLEVTGAPDSNADFTPSVYARSVDGTALGPVGPSVNLPFNVEGQARAPIITGIPSNLHIAEGQSSELFSIRCVPSAGDTCVREVIIPPGGTLSNTNGQVYSNSGSSSLTQDISTQPDSGWSYTYTGSGSGDLTVNFIGEDGTHTAPPLVRHINVEIFENPDVQVLQDGAATNTLTALEDHPNTFNLNVTADASAVQTNVTVSAPVPTGAAFSGDNYVVQGTSIAGSSPANISMVPDPLSPGHLTASLNSFNLSNSFSIFPPEDLNSGNQGGAPDFTFNARSAASDGLISSSNTVVSVGWQPVVDLVPFNPISPGSEMTLSRGSVQSFYADPNSLTPGAPGETFLGIKSSPMPAGTYIREVDFFGQNPVELTPNPDGTVQLDIVPYTTLRYGAGANATAPEQTANMSHCLLQRDFTAFGESCHFFNLTVTDGLRRRAVSEDEEIQYQQQRLTV